MARWILGIVFLLLTACNADSGNDNGGSNQAQGLAEYSGVVNTMVTSGPCSFEDTRAVGGVLNMSCDLSNANARYFINADMVNDVTGYADLTELPSGNRIRVEVTWLDGDGRYPPSQFQITTDPAVPPATSYTFVRQ